MIGCLQFHFAGDEVADRPLPVRVEDSLQIHVHAGHLTAADGEGKVETPVVSIRIGKFPLAGDIGHGHVGGHARRIERGDVHRADDDDRGPHRREGRVIQGEAAEKVVLEHEQIGDLPYDVAGHCPEGGEDRGLGQEEQTDVAGRQADHAVDTDLPGPLVHGAHHRIEDDESGDEHRDEQLSGAADLRGADRAVGHHLPFLADEEGQRHPRHERLDGLPEVGDILGLFDGDRAQPPVHGHDPFVGQEQTVFHLQVVEGLDGGGRHVARILAALGDQLGIFLDRVHRGQRLTVQVHQLAKAL